MQQRKINKKKLLILGTRGIPASHGGFETFAEELALYLTKDGWKVTIYNQENGFFKKYESKYMEINRIHIKVPFDGPISTLIFDFLAVMDSLTKDGVVMTLGYNSAVFNIFNFLKGQKNIINMDGIEWKRDKWGFLPKAWFWFNEMIARKIGTYLIADNPEIEKHICRFKKIKNVKMIPYGANEPTKSSEDLLKNHGLKRNNYCLIIARLEPENSILQAVKAFSKKSRGIKLVIVGHVDKKNSYHQKLLSESSTEVKFLGTIYEKSNIETLRVFSKFYFHGHTVGGTNPSLVEAMACKNNIIANDNVFNKWVLGENAFYFKTSEELEFFFDVHLNDVNYNKYAEDIFLRYKKIFTWKKILKEYKNFLNDI